MNERYRINRDYFVPLEDTIKKDVTYDAYEGYEMFQGPRMETDTIRVCPLCKDHSYGRIGLYHDCKNVFVTEINGKMKVIAQCECSGPEHGRRK